MKRIFTLIFLLCIFVQQSQAQVNGQQPTTALSICDGTSLNMGSVPSFNGGGIPGSCLAAGALNPFWYIFTFNCTGTFGFTITPNNGSDDYDFAVFDITGQLPNAMFSNSGLQVSCNYSGYTGVTGCTSGGSGSVNGANGSNQNQLINVTPGMTLALVVSHYTSSSQSGYQLAFTGGTCTPIDVQPSMDATVVNSCNKLLNVTFNKSMKCNTIAANGSDFYIMPGNIALTSATGVGCGSSSFTNLVSLGLPTTLGVGNYTLHIKNGSDGNTMEDVCGNDVATTDQIAFSIAPAPQPAVGFTVNPTDTLCLNGNSFAFTNTSTVSSGSITSYSWRFGDGQTATFTNGSHSYGVAGNFPVKLIGTTNQGCIDSSVVHNVSVKSSPAKPTITTPVSYCVNQVPVALIGTAASGNTINWYATIGGVASPTAPTPSTSTAGVYTWYVSQTEPNGCESYKDSIKVNVKPYPAGLTANSNTPVCVNDSIHLTASSTDAGVTYSWAGPNSFTNSTQSPNIAPASLAMNGTYKAYVTLNGCKDSITTDVVVKPLPAGLTATSNSPVCSGINNSINLHASTTDTGATYTWTGVNSYTATGQNPVIAAADTSMKGHYTVTVTAHGCTDTIGTNILVNQTPDIPTITTHTFSYCNNETAAQLSATGTSLKWYTSVGGTASATAPTPSTAIAGMKTYYVSQTVNGCEGPLDSIVVTTKPLPAKPTVTSPIFYCKNDVPGMLTATPATGGSLNWYATATSTPALGSVPVPTAVTPGSYTWYVSQTVNGCEGARDSITVVVKALPAGLVASSNSPVCSGVNNSINLHASTTDTGATYTWNGVGSYSGTGQNPVINAAATSMTGHYTATVTAHGCTDTIGTDVLVNQTPGIPTIAHTIAFCNNSVATQLTATGTNLKWYTAIGGTASTTAPTPSTATPGNTTYYVTQTIAGCEGPADSIVVTIKPLPAPPTVTSPVLYCNNDVPVALTATPATGGTLNWYTTATGTTPLAGAPTPSTVTPGDYKWYVSQTVIGCEGARDSITVRVKPLPNIPTIGSNTPVCSGTGNTLNLNAASTSTGVTYSWTGPNSFTSAQQNPSVTAPSVAASGKYIMVVTLNGCIRKDSTDVVINQTPPVPTVTSSFSYCQYLPTATLTATPMTGYTIKWYTSPTTGTGSTTAPTPSSQVPGTTTWYVSQTSTAGCEGPRAAISVTIKPKPQPPIVTHDYTYCQYENIPALTANGQNLLWYSNSAGGTGTPIAPVPVTLVPGSFIWFVSQTVNGCESDRDSIKAIVLPKPAPPTVVTPVTYCQYETAQPLTAIGQNKKWYTTSSGGVGSPTAPVPYTVYEDTLSYWVTQTVNGCESDRTKMDVIINYQPNGTILASKSTVCQYDTISFNYYGNARPDADYDWSSLLHASTLVSGSGQGPIVVRFDSVGNYNVRMQVNNHGCVSKELFYNVKVVPAPLTRLSVKPDVCQDEITMLALSYTSLPIDHYDWQLDGANIAYGSEQGPFGISWHQPGLHTVQLIATGNGCLSKPVIDTVMVHALPDAKITSVSKTDVCSDDSVTFEARVTLDSGYSYQWLPANYFIDGMQHLPVATAKIPFTNYVKLMATSDWGCVAMDSVLITAKPCCEVYFPDAFTPNADGKNDVFRIITRGSHQIATFRVVNRWGQVVFETTDERKGWDGTFGGAAQPMDTYYYYIKYKCYDGQFFEQRGEVTLIR